VGILLLLGGRRVDYVTSFSARWAGGFDAFVVIVLVALMMMMMMMILFPVVVARNNPRRSISTSTCYTLSTTSQTYRHPPLIGPRGYILKE
jgi:hypothetical protein